MSNKRFVSRTKWGEEPEFFGPLHYFRESLILTYLISALRKGKILDVGFGSGSFCFRLVSKGFQVEGIDSSLEFVKYVNRKIKEMGIKEELVVRKGDATSLDFENASFNGLVCGEVLEHIENDFLAVKEINRVLKKRGVCVMTVPCNPNLWDLSDDWGGHFRRYTKSELRALLEKNGFKIDKIEYWGFPIARIWHSCIYLPLLKNKLNQPAKNMKMSSKTAKLQKFSPLISRIFEIDNLFNRFPWGIGLVVRAIKI